MEKKVSPQSEKIAQALLLDTRIHGEQVIAIIRIIICIILFVMVIIVFSTAFQRENKGIVEAFLEPAFVTEMFCIITSAIISIWILKKVKQKKYYTWMPYVFPFIDITFLSIIVYLNALNKPGLIITGAPTFLYFVFIALASLRNSPSSVVFTGLYSAIVYSFITHMHVIFPLGISEPGSNVFINNLNKFITVDWDDEVYKPVIVIMTTGILTYYAYRFKKMVIEQTSMRVEKEETRHAFTVNLKEVTRNILSSSSTLSRTSEKFTRNIEGLVTSARKIGDESNTGLLIMAETSSTITEMAGSIRSVTENIKKQATLVHEGVSAIEEMGSSITVITETSKRADAISENLLNAAQEGEKTVFEVVEATRETEKASKKIEEIVEIISAIAETTNLLAMNAAIEAAHAGEAGRGFAVVADEIRNLAETTGANAGKIGDILKDILGRIENIVMLSEGAGTRLKSILEDAQKTAQINSEILKAMEEESRTVNDMLTSFHSLSEISEEVKHASEEQSEGSKGILTAIEHLTSEAERVDELTKTQVDECRKINEISSELAVIVEKNSSIINTLEQLVKGI